MASHSSANATKLKTLVSILQFVKEVLQIQISSKKPLFVIAKILLSILYFSLTSNLSNSDIAKFIKKKDKKTIPKSFFIILFKSENYLYGSQADSNAGNFLLGVMMAMQEDWACDPYR